MRISGLIKVVLFIFLAFPGAKAGDSIPVRLTRDTISNGKANFSSSFEKGLYKATLDISKHHLSGFIFLKRTSDTSYRIIFSNQVGMKFFDLEVTEKELIVHYCFPSLERKSLLKLLETDFRIFLFPFGGIKKISLISVSADSTDFKVKTVLGKWIYRIANESSRIISMDSKGKIIGKTRIRVKYSDQYPSMIMINNPTIRLSLKMDLITP
jgi:hypothetical protein